MGVAFVSLAEGIDATTPAGRLQLHVLGAIAEFERARIAERVRADLARAGAHGVTLGRPRRELGPEQLTTRATRSRGSAQTWRLTLNTPTLARPTRARVDSLTLRFRCCLKGLTGCHLDGQNHVGSTACALGRSSVGRH